MSKQTLRARTAARARTGAIDYLWHLSGRPGEPHLEGDPAAVEALLAARVVF